MLSKDPNHLFGEYVVFNYILAPKFKKFISVEDFTTCGTLKLGLHIQLKFKIIKIYLKTHVCNCINA